MEDFTNYLGYFPEKHTIREFGNSQVGVFVENNFLVWEHILVYRGYLLRQCLLTRYTQPASIALVIIIMDTKKLVY